MKRKGAEAPTPRRIEGGKVTARFKQQAKRLLRRRARLYRSLGK